MSVTGRSYFDAYGPVRRAEEHQFVRDAVIASGGQVLWDSGDREGPLYLAVRNGDGQVLGVLAYVFRATLVLTRNRPDDEHRGQIRYGDVNSAAWRQADHPLGLDPAGVDTTLVLVVDPSEGIIVALEPTLYDPLPLGSSVYWKTEQTEEIRSAGWVAWELESRRNRNKTQPLPGVESRIGIRPERFLDLVAFEHEAQLLGHDTGLRLQRAQELAQAGGAVGLDATNELGLTGDELLQVIQDRFRLAVAVRGGVAEFHAERQLRSDPVTTEVWPNTGDGTPDFFVTLRDGRTVRVEVKNASPTRYSNGDAKVEVQKTRASKNDPLSRWYEPSAFDVLAACMHGPEGGWGFRYRWTSDLALREDDSGRLAPMQRITADWACSLSELLASRR